MLSRLNISVCNNNLTRKDSVIDNILTNDIELVTDSGILSPFLSDHEACYVVKIFNSKPKFKLPVYKRNYDRINYED